MASWVRLVRYGLLVSLLSLPEMARGYGVSAPSVGLLLQRQRQEKDSRSSSSGQPSPWKMISSLPPYLLPPQPAKVQEGPSSLPDLGLSSALRVSSGAPPPTDEVWERMRQGAEAIAVGVADLVDCEKEDCYDSTSSYSPSILVQAAGDIARYRLALKMGPRMLGSACCLFVRLRRGAEKS